MNDVKTHPNDDSMLRLLYADDSKIYIQVSIDQINHGFYVLPKDTCKASDWAKFWMNSDEIVSLGATRPSPHIQEIS